CGSLQPVIKKSGSPGSDGKHFCRLYFRRSGPSKNLVTEPGRGTGFRSGAFLKDHLFQAVITVIQMFQKADHISGIDAGSLKEFFYIIFLNMVHAALSFLLGFLKLPEVFSASPLYGKAVSGLFWDFFLFFARFPRR